MIKIDVTKIIDLIELFSNNTPSLNEIEGTYSKIEVQTLYSFLIWVEALEQKKVSSATIVFKELKYANDGIYVMVNYFIQTKPIQEEHQYKVKITKKLVKEFLEIMLEEETK